VSLCTSRACFVCGHLYDLVMDTTVVLVVSEVMYLTCAVAWQLLHGPVRAAAEPPVAPRAARYLPQPTLLPPGTVMMGTACRDP
jgi:hypothetical protein